MTGQRKTAMCVAIGLTSWTCRCARLQTVIDSGVKQRETAVSKLACCPEMTQVLSPEIADSDLGALVLQNSMFNTPCAPPHKLMRTCAPHPGCVLEATRCSIGRFRRGNAKLHGRRRGSVPLAAHSEITAQASVASPIVSLRAETGHPVKFSVHLLHDHNSSNHVSRQRC